MTSTFNESSYKDFLKKKKKPELQKLCEEYNVSKYGNKDLLIYRIMNPNKCKKNKKATPKQNEDKRVKEIRKQMNNDTGYGPKLKHDYKTVIGKEIKKVDDSGGGLKDHYDLICVHTDGTEHKIEEKGTEIYHPFISEKTVPWENSVQRYNGPGKQFKICRRFVELWYDNVICDENIKKQYCPDIPIPSKKKWIDNDAFSIDPKTDYGKALKKNYRELHPPLKGTRGNSMNGKNGSPEDMRKRVIPKFIMTQQDKDTLISELQSKLNDTMGVKDAWLQTTGDPSTDTFNWRWYKKINSPKIKDIILDTSRLDIYFKCITEDESCNFDCIMRFGKGTGFSCVRIDIR